jgi:O-methyltransferase domain/Dimerisation domain
VRTATQRRRLPTRSVIEARGVSDSAAHLRALANGHQVSQAIHVAATLGLADLLGDGSRTSDELAEATGSHPGALYRLLRALASVGVFREEEGRRFALTPIGEHLRVDDPQSLTGWAAMIGRPYFRKTWTALGESVRTGENAFRLVHGTDVWTWRSMHPEESAIFDRAMTSTTRQVNRELLDAFDFGRFATIVDVGGGNGFLLASILARHSTMQGVLFDQEHVVVGAGPVLEAAGVADRCRVVGGSFFDAVPAGGDAYILKSIIHDWDDEEAVAILRVCRRAGGVVLLIERVVGPPNEDPATKFLDLNMLVMPGGRERTLDEYAALFEASGFSLVGETPTEGGTSVIEGAPA